MTFTDPLLTCGLMMLYLAGQFAPATSRVFYNVAHMTNTVAAVDWALGHGANGLEVDMAFNQQSGEVDRFIHSQNTFEFCDCSCMCPLTRCGLIVPSSVCAILERDSSKRISPCSSSSTVANLLNRIASKKTVALLIIDSKVDEKMSEDIQISAAKHLMSALEKYLFACGYFGNVIVSVPKFSGLRFLKMVSQLAWRSEYGHGIYVSIDQEGNNIVGVIKALQETLHKNIVYGTGRTVCLPNPITQNTYKLALINTIRGAVGMSYVWTFNKQSSMEGAVEFFDGIITNYPGTLSAILRARNIQLAKPGDRIPPARTNEIASSQSYSCDCSYRAGGCVITKVPPPGLACRCLYVGFWTCSGEVTRCNDQQSYYCSNPDMSLRTCILGSGDCEGYKAESCDCDYHPGGCRISKAAISGVACKCNYKGFWTCGGEPVACRNPSSIDCLSPTTNAGSCLQGGGDCGGYGACDCNYSPGGCRIVKSAPAGTACKCEYKGLWTCGGQIVNCPISSAPKCISPDSSAEACALGAGDCGGYGNNGCDCDYKRGGCVISKAPPKYTACKCVYHVLWRCSGTIVMCPSFNDPKCVNPDNSIATCFLGGGDCGGY